MNNMLLNTKYRDINNLIINQLDKEDLNNLSQINENYFNEKFWKNRSLSKFGKVVGEIDNWKEYHDSNTALCKISKLLKSEIFTLLQRLSQHVVVAGSSAAYGLGAPFSGDKVGDIDLFILKGEPYILQLEKYVTMIKEYWKDIGFGIDMYGEEDGVSVLNIYNEDIEIGMVLQFVCTNYETPQEVINNFDFDYIQAAIHKNKTYYGKTTLESWEKKQIITATSIDIPLKRFEKALDKGFKTPVFVNSLYDGSDYSGLLILDFNEVDYIPLERDNCEFIYVSKLNLIGKKLFNYLAYEDTHYIQYIYKFMMSDGITDFMCEYITQNGYLRNTENREFHNPSINYSMITNFPYNLKIIDMYPKEKYQLLKNWIDCDYIKNEKRAFQSYLSKYDETQDVIKACKYAAGTYMYDTSKRKVYPYDLDGNIRCPISVTNFDTMLKYIWLKR